MIRKCLRCGEQWHVPAALVGRRRTRDLQPGGISVADYLGTKGIQTNAMASILLDMANGKEKPRRASSDTAEEMSVCPNCGAVGVVSDRPVPRLASLKRWMRRLMPRH